MLLYGVVGFFFFLLIISFYKPNWGVAIFLLLCVFFTDYFLIRISLEILTPYPLKIYLVAAFVIGCLLRVMKTRCTNFRILNQDIILLIFLSYCTLVTLIALIGEYALAVNVILLVKLGMMGVLYFSIVGALHTPDDIEKVAWAIILGSVIVSIFSIWDLLQGVEKRGFGIVGANSTGFFCSLALPFVFALMRIRQSERKIPNFIFIVLYSSIMALLILAVVASGSRGGFLAIVISLILSLIVIKIKWRDAVTLGITLLVICAIVVITGHGQYLEFPLGKFSTLLEHIVNLSLPTDPNVTVRIEATKVGFDALSARPVFGVGPGVFRVTKWHGAPENLYMQILVDYGVAGFTIALVLGLLVLQTFCRALHRTKQKQLLTLSNWTAAFAISYVTMLVFGLTNDLFYEIFLWFFFAIGASCLHISSVNKLSKEKQ